MGDNGATAIAPLPSHELHHVVPPPQRRTPSRWARIGMPAGTKAKARPCMSEGSLILVHQPSLTSLDGPPPVSDLVALSISLKACVISSCKSLKSAVNVERLGLITISTCVVVLFIFSRPASGRRLFMRFRCPAPPTGLPTVTPPRQPRS